MNKKRIIYGDQISVSSQGDVNIAKDKSVIYNNTDCSGNNKERVLPYQQSKIIDEKNNINQTKTPDASWFAWSITLIIAIVATILVPLYLSIKKNPEFIILNSELTVNDSLVIQADNKKANKKIELNVFFDKMAFPKAAFPIESGSDKQQWQFDLQKYTSDKSLLKTGEHSVKVGFPGDKLSAEFTIKFKAK